MKPRPWTARPGILREDLHAFTAGVLVITGSRVLAFPGEHCALRAGSLVAEVPAGSGRLSELVAAHESGVADGVDYHARWAALYPTAREPFHLLRLDLRLAGEPPLEARLLFDAAVHLSDLWAAVHSEAVALMSPERFPHAPDIYPRPGDLPRALTVTTDASPVAQMLGDLQIPDPFHAPIPPRHPH